MNCETVLKNTPVALLLMVLISSGQGVERLASCCTSVSNKEITEPIQGYMIQERNLPCVSAVIFQTKSGLYCSSFRAPWVFLKIKELRKAKALSTIPSSSPSLLSTLTSNAPSSSSTSSPESVTPSSPSLPSILNSPSSSSTSSSTIYSDSAPTEQVDESLWDILSSSASTPAGEEMPQTSSDETVS